MHLLHRVLYLQSAVCSNFAVDTKLVSPFADAGDAMGCTVPVATEEGMARSLPTTWMISYRPGSFLVSAFSIIRQKNDRRLLPAAEKQAINSRRPAFVLLL